MDEDFKFFVMLFGVIIFVIGLLLLGLYAFEKYIYCPNIGKELEMPTKYNFWANGCYVQLDNGQWIESINYRGVELDK